MKKVRCCPVGLHMRVNTTMQECVEQAKKLQLPVFQCFFLHQPTSSYITISPQEARFVAQEAARFFDQRFAHASYWINLAADATYSGLNLLRFELEMAKRLAFPYLVLHPGSGSTTDKTEAIGNIARKLNLLLKHEKEVVILLENAAFGKNSVGGDIQELAAIKERLDHPEKVHYCLDTAHAYSYGYDLRNSQVQQQWIELIGSTLGFDSIRLIHLNDTDQELGSKKDRHAVFGKGQIGQDALISFVKGFPLLGIPCILELPVLPDHELCQIVHMVQQLLIP